MRRILKDKVLAYDAAGLSANEIAALLNCHPAYVRATRMRNGRCASRFRLAQVEECLEAAKAKVERLEIERRKLKAAIRKRGWHSPSAERVSVSP
jgi:hypothetical protein